MRVLLDTHALVWWLSNDSRLSREASRILSDESNEILVSAAVGWEITIKVNLGKIEPASLIEKLEGSLTNEAFSELPITMTHVIKAGLLPLYHRDPFDRLLAAQAQSLDLPILSADRLLDHYSVRRIW
jgi:PIN domain nuclease of toxin-antitoxin system